MVSKGQSAIEYNEKQKYQLSFESNLSNDGNIVYVN